MMRVLGHIAAVCVLLFVHGLLRADQTSVLKDVHIATQGGHCKVSFAFTGDVRFSTEQGKGTVRLVFSRVRPATAGTILRRMVPSGPVESISFARPAPDSLIATLVLAEGSTYRCVRPSAGNELYVDVNGRSGLRQTPRTAAAGTGAARATAKAPAQTGAASGTVRTNEKAPAQAGAGSGAAGVAAKARAKTGTASGTAHVTKDSPARGATALQATGNQRDDRTAQASTSTLIDIPAVAREQVDLEGRAEAQQSSSAPDPASAPQTSKVLALLLSAGLSLFSTVMTIGIWYKMRQRIAERKPARPAAQASREFTRPPEMTEPVDIRDEFYDTDDAGKQELLAALMQDDMQEDDGGRETSLQMARTFKRGSEEITLARRFHEQGAVTVTSERMQSALSRATTKTQRLQAARKLGVGRGEFDLALKLKSMVHVQGKKEEEQ